MTTKMNDLVHTSFHKIGGGGLVFPDMYVYV